MKQLYKFIKIAFILLVIGISLFSCKRVKQTDIPLYEVLIEKTWKDLDEGSETGHNFMKFSNNGVYILDNNCPAVNDTIIIAKWELEGEKTIAVYASSGIPDTWGGTEYSDYFLAFKFLVKKYSETIVKGIIPAEYTKENKDKNFKIEVCD